jgi:ABC-type Na+ transport system ATPase subunit NatA
LQLIAKGNFEKTSESLNRDDDFVLKVRGLQKVFANSKVAVGGASFTIHSG